MKRTIAVDALALAAYAVASLPSLTGIGPHEWLGLAVLVVLVVHVAQHGDWAVRAVYTAVSNPTAGRTGRLALDALVAVVLAVVVVSGIMVSGEVLPSLGYVASGYYFWDPLHAVSAKVLLALLLVHVVVDAGIAYRVLRGAPGLDESDGSVESDGAGESGEDAASDVSGEDTFACGIEGFEDDRKEVR